MQERKTSIHRPTASWIPLGLLLPLAKVGNSLLEKRERTLVIQRAARAWTCVFCGGPEFGGTSPVSDCKNANRWCCRTPSEHLRDVSYSLWKSARSTQILRKRS